MNAYATTGIRELTAQELDLVTGGRGAEMDGTERIVSAMTVGALVGGLLCWLADLLMS